MTGNHPGDTTLASLTGTIGMNGGGEPGFPEARALQYSPERWWAYLPCSRWVREGTPPLWPPVLHL